MKRYQIAMYIRLSKEDDREGGESNSITMQRVLLRRYVADNFSDYDLLEFCDDGYTGTNFERPGIQNMLKLVRNSQINCIVVKDFSRFARDYIEAGAYLEQIFPFMGVRFISVNDNYDSKNCQENICDINVSFKNLLYDLYSKDLARKVSSSLAVRKEQGLYVSGNCPFGYEKDPTDRHNLLIAEDEAEVVRRIFSLTVEGYTSVEIARLFNQMGVRTPVSYKIEKGRTSRVPKGKGFLWSSGTICQILRNEIYIGNIVQKKYQKNPADGKTHLRPCEEWITAYNHHKPIIDREIFDKVQKGRGKKRNARHAPSHPLTGKLACGCCKRNLRYRMGKNPYFTCQGRYTNLMEDCVVKAYADFLEQHVLFKIQEKLQAEEKLDKLHRETVERMDKELRNLKKKKTALLAKTKKIKQQKFEAYSCYVSGSAESFDPDDTIRIKIRREMEILNASIENLEREREELDHQNWFTALSAEIVDQLVDKILVYKENQIEIYWKKNNTDT